MKVETSATRRTKTDEKESADITLDLESHGLIKTSDLEAFSPENDKNKKDKCKQVKSTAQERMISFNYCEDCDNIRPPRATHCRYCGSCVMRADHHCAWIGNCVAFNTHKNFFLFLCYTTMLGYLESSCYMYGWFNGYYGKFPKDIR